MSCSLVFSNGANVPLLSVKARIDVVDVLASVELSQVFYNQDGVYSGDATYQFPVPPGAAVCAFEAELDDGTTIVGLVKEKTQAKKEYEQAIAKGQQAALASQIREDIFNVSIGNIGPKSRVTIHLTYVVELLDDGDADQIRLVIPTYIAPKYGWNPNTEISTTEQNTRKPFEIAISVQMLQPIRTIASPSHPVAVSTGALSPTEEEHEFNPKHAHVTFASDAMLDQDLIVTIKASGLDAPRCTSEVYKSLSYPKAPEIFTQPEDLDGPPATLALALTLVPRFQLPPIQSQEYIFVADRSGSMGGKPIQRLKEAFQLLLRSLPPDGTFIQIVSFGSTYSSLFPGKSVAYTEESMAHISKFIDTMDSDMGGTEIQSALKDGAFRNRRKDIPTSVFLMTDGEVWNKDEVFSTVQTACATTKDEKPLRVFALGIGGAVDAALVGGITQRGNGIAQFVGEGERMEAKVIKLLRSAKSPPVKDVVVEWLPKKTVQIDDDWEEVPAEKKEPEPVKQKLSLFDPTHKPEEITPKNLKPVEPSKPVALPPFATIQQGPATIPFIYSGSRTIVYSILADGVTEPPQQVILRAKTEQGDELELVIPVEQSTTSLNKDSTVPLVHILAARRLLSDLEKADLYSVGKIRANMVRLGMTYNLASKHTSFIAIEPEEKAKTHILAPKIVTVWHHHHYHHWCRPLPIYKTLHVRREPAPPPPVAQAAAMFGGQFSSRMAAPPPPLGRPLASPTVRSRGAPAPRGQPLASVSARVAPTYFKSKSAAPGSALPPPPSAPAAYQDMHDDEEDDMGFLLTDSLPTTPKSAHRFAPSPDRDRSRSRRAVSETQEEFAAPRPRAVTNEAKRAALIRLQGFKGSFNYLKDVLDVLDQEKPSSGLSDEVLATVIALAWLIKMSAAEKDEWEWVGEKAQTFLDNQPNQDLVHKELDAWKNKFV